jgi:gentisate 1,2-dioxygenase
MAAQHGYAILSGRKEQEAHLSPEAEQALQVTHLMGLWKVGPEHVPRVPRPQTRPYLWLWQDLSRLVALSWRFVPVEQGPSRRVFDRVLALVNPAGRKMGTTDTLFAVIQSLLPGETLLAHRHSMQAIRFILAGLLFSPGMEPARRWMANS